MFVCEIERERDPLYWLKDHVSIDFCKPNRKSLLLRRFFPFFCELAKQLKAQTQLHLYSAPVAWATHTRRT